MFSNVAMNPYGPGGSIVTAQSPRGGQPDHDPRSAAPGERGAAGTRAEAVARIAPPAQPATAAALPREDRRDAPEPQPRPEAAGFGTRFTPMPFPPALGPKAGSEDRVEPKGPDAEGAASGDVPAGPPPAFQRSLLDARRAETVAPDPAPATISAPEPAEAAPETFSAPAMGAAGAPPDAVTVVADGTAAETPARLATTSPSDADPLTAVIRQLVAESAQIEVPPSAEDRAEAEFSGLRRMEAPYDTATVDVTR